MTALLRVDGVVAGYLPELPIVNGVSLEVEAGEIVTILGPNGAGKSTLVKAIAGLVPIAAGDVRLEGASVANRPAHLMPALGIGYVPQVGNVFTTLSVTENLRLCGRRLGRAPAEQIERVFALFPSLAARRRHLGGQLSGGERQMLAFARALVAEPRLVIADEPSAGLSPRMTGTIFAMLRELASTGVAVLIVEQNVRAALRLADRAYILAQGRNRLEGRAAELIDDDRVRRIYLGMADGAEARP